jgi:uncharacterized phage protein (TIGR01671 family)
MNRKIEFRGKLSHSGEWVFGSLLKIDSKYHIVTESDMYEDGHHICQESDTPTWVDPYTVGQFTGLTDKNGVKIFEGDIVRVCDEDDIDIGVVKYNEDFGKYVVVYSQVSGNWFDFEGTDSEFLAAFCSEVIGNVYNNPELLSTK